MEMQFSYNFPDSREIYGTFEYSMNSFLNCFTHSWIKGEILDCLLKCHKLQFLMAAILYGKNHIIA